MITYKTVIWQTGQRIAAQTFPPSNPHLPASTESTTEQWLRPLEFTRITERLRLPKTCIYMGDFNAYFVAWKYRRSQRQNKMWRTEVDIFTGKCWVSIIIKIASTWLQLENCGKISDCLNARFGFAVLVRKKLLNKITRVNSP